MKTRTQKSASAMPSATACFHFTSVEARAQITATAKVAGGRPARSISKGNVSTAARMRKLGYHRPASIGGPSTVTARSPITAPNTRRPMAQQHRHIARPHARDAADVVIAAEPKPGEADDDQDDRGPDILRALDAQHHGLCVCTDGSRQEPANLFDSSRLGAFQRDAWLLPPSPGNDLSKSDFRGLVAPASCD